MNNRGFTLIETIIYIGLFALIIGGSFLAVYQILQGSAQVAVKSTVQDEESFALRKIEWALGSVQTISSPVSGTSGTLSLTRYDGTQVVVRLNGTKIELSENGGTSYLPITSDNVPVNALSFAYVQSGVGPAGITASMTIKDVNDPQTFNASTTKYIRK